MGEHNASCQYRSYKSCQRYCGSDRFLVARTNQHRVLKRLQFNFYETRGQGRIGQMVFWDIPEHIYNRDISLRDFSAYLQSQMQVRPHIVSTLHFNVMKWKEVVDVITLYATTFLAQYRVKYCRNISQGIGSSHVDKPYPSVQVSKYPSKQGYKFASMQVYRFEGICKYASMQICKYASMQVCKYASMQVCRYAGMQVCNKVSMQVYRYADMQVCRYTSMQVCKYASMLL